MRNWFIFGAGFSGIEIGRQLAATGAPVAGTTRNEAKFEILHAAGLEALRFDGQLDAALTGRLSAATHLIISIGPDHSGDPLVPQHGAALSAAMPNLKWIGYLSTVGVYGDHEGAWVEETTPCRPASGRSIVRLKSEAAWQAFADSKTVPIAILRLSGIYGPGRNTFCNLADGSAKRLIKKGQVFNRIHVEDIAGAARFLASRKLGGIFNITDDEPAPPQDVVTFAAEMMGVSPPPELDYDSVILSPMARSFYGEVKRVSNVKLKSAGYALRYPEYRSALAALWEDGSWRDGR
ncbi:MAG: SDR family oxidoreductase [Rhizobiaceae bacterium]